MIVTKEKYGYCKHCNKLYIKIQKTQVWCSKKCRQKGNYHQNKERILENKKKRIWKGREKEREEYEEARTNKKCLICKKELIGNQFKFCSKNCKHKNWYNKEWARFYTKKYALTRAIRNRSSHKPLEKRCFVCGNTGKRERHHITYIPDISITLCRKCHIRIHKNLENKEGDTTC